MAKLASIRYVYRCAACSAKVEDALLVGEVARGEQLHILNDEAPPGWEMFHVFATAIGVVWLCPRCMETPDESRALVALKLGIRFV